MSPEAEKVIVIHATEDDVRQAVQTALDEAGLTLSQVREQARRGRFCSNEAYWAWFVVKAAGYDVLQEA